MGIDSIEHANISSLPMGQDMPLLRLHHDRNTVLVTRSPQTLNKTPHSWSSLSVTVLTSQTVEEDLLAPLGGPLMISLGLLEVELPTMGNPKTNSIAQPGIPKQETHHRSQPPHKTTPSLPQYSSMEPPPPHHPTKQSKTPVVRTQQKRKNLEQTYSLQH
jgi:hypothetical protein